MADWFSSSTPALSQFGSTIGRGMPSTATGGGGLSPSQFQQYAQLVEEQTAYERQQADQAYGLKKKEIDQQYQIAKLNARTAREAQEIDRWYQEQQVSLAQQRLTQENQQFDKRLAFDREVQSQNLGLNQARLGYDVLNMSANLRGPSDYFQAAAFNRGVANDPQSATFLNALRSNTQMADFGAQGGVPTPETLGTLTAKLTGQTAAPAAGNDARLGQIKDLYAQGAHKLGAGALENLSGTERQLLGSGIDAVGGDQASFLEQYKRSRIGQGIGNSRAA
jgi:hypothetical protein